jgi:hypothetical protein
VSESLKCNAIIKKRVNINQTNLSIQLYGLIFNNKESNSKMNAPTQIKSVNYSISFKESFKTHQNNKKTGIDKEILRIIASKGKQ